MDLPVTGSTTLQSPHEEEDAVSKATSTETEGLSTNSNRNGKADEYLSVFTLPVRAEVPGGGTEFVVCTARLVFALAQGRKVAAGLLSADVKGAFYSAIAELFRWTIDTARIPTTCIFISALYSRSDCCV